MKLNELRDNEGAVKSKNALAVVQVLAKVKWVAVVSKVKNLVLV